jgi:hypothetical protein
VPDDPNEERNRAVDAKSRLATHLRSVRQVNGVGVENIGGSWAIKVNVSSDLPDDVQVPETFDGFPVRIEKIGSIHKL